MRPARAPFAPPPGSNSGGSGMRTNVATTQQTADPGFATAGQWTLSGSGIGASAVTGGVLQVTSTTNVYFALPATADTPLYPGVYTVTFTILSYVTGNISWIASTSSALSGGTTGTSRGANGTFTENVSLPAGGYIGLGGLGAAIVNSLQVDDMTIYRAG